MIKPGTYAGTIQSHVISETKAGEPQAAITFSLESEGRPHTMTWFGSFKEGKAREITIKTLLICGLKGNNPAGPLEIGKQLSLVVEEEKGQDGKVRSRIRWINALGAVKNVIPKDMAISRLDSLAGAVAAARMENGAHEIDEIPF